MADFLAELLGKTVVEIDTAVAPTIRLNVAEATAEGPQGLASKLLDARVTLYVDGRRVFPAVPYPPRAPSLWPLLALAGVGFAVWRWTR